MCEVVKLRVNSHTHTHIHAAMGAYNRCINVSLKTVLYRICVVVTVMYVLVLLCLIKMDLYEFYVFTSYTRMCKYMC